MEGMVESMAMAAEQVLVFKDLNPAVNPTQPYRFNLTTTKTAKRIRIINGLFISDSTSVPQRLTFNMVNLYYLFDITDTVSTVPPTSFVDLPVPLKPGEEMSFYLTDARTVGTFTTFGANDNLTLILEFQ